MTASKAIQADELPDQPGIEPRRRTQSERSAEMRSRLIEATVICLNRDGYAGTTVSTIINTAGVSRGAPIHHFPNKSALIVATAEHLIRKVYILLGEAVKELTDSEDRLSDMIMASWRGIFKSDENGAMLELMLASKRDAELAGAMSHIWQAGADTLRVATEHYFVARNDNVNIHQLMVLTHWLLRGMSIDSQLTHGDHIIEHYIQLWCRLLSAHMKPRPGVTTPPPRPAHWDNMKSVLP